MALFIFFITLFCIYFRPFKIPVWIFSTIGAVFAYIFGVVNMQDIAFVWNMVWDSSFTLIGLIIFAISLEKIGFFNAFANLIIKFSKHKKTSSISTKRFYFFIIIFGFIISAFFSNDGAILILTPLIIALFSTLESKQSSIKSTTIAFLLCMSFVSDFGSNIFIFSNLTNIITTHTFSLSFISFVSYMFLPQLFVMFASIVIFWLFFGRNFPKILNFNIIDSNVPSNLCMFLCFILLFILVLGIIFGERFGVPISFVTLFIAIISMFMAMIQHKTTLKNIIKDSPLSVVVFSLGLFIVVYGLSHIGLIDMLRNTINEIKDESLFNKIALMAIGSSIGSSIINNLPMVMLGDLALNGNDIYLAYAHLLGCNIGSKMTPIGSLATLLWLISLKRYDISISFFSYMKVAFFATIFVLFFAIFGLYLSSLLLIEF